MPVPPPTFPSVTVLFEAVSRAAVTQGSQTCRFMTAGRSQGVYTPDTRDSLGGCVTLDDLIKELAALERQAAEGTAPLLEPKTEGALQGIRRDRRRLTT